MTGPAYTPSPAAVTWAYSIQPDGTSLATFAGDTNIAGSGGGSGGSTTVENITVNQVANIHQLFASASQASGASVNIAEGAAPTSPNNGDLWTTSAGLYVRINGVTIGPLSAGGSAGPVAPQGRLTLASGVPVQVFNVADASSVYYTPYVGNQASIYNGSAFVAYPFGQLTMALDATNHPSGNIYDLFLYVAGGVAAVGAGPAWTSLAARSAAIDLSLGIWSNTGAITLTNGAGSGVAVAAHEATYIGSVYTTANGQTTMQPVTVVSSDGSGNGVFLGVYNAYNRVRTTGQKQDNQGPMTITGTMWEVFGGNGDRINVLDGLGQSEFYVFCQSIMLSDGVAGTQIFVGVGFNTASALPAALTQGVNEVTQLISINCQGHLPASLGLSLIYPIATTSNNGGTAYSVSLLATIDC